MTPLLKKVSRRCTVAGWRGRRFVVTIEPGDLVGVRIERTRSTVYLPIAAIYSMAVKLDMAAKKRDKAIAKMAKRKS